MTGSAGRTGRLVDRFGTGYLQTEVRECGAGHRWIRWPGPLRPTPLATPDHTVRAAIEGLPGAGVRLALPEPDGDAVHYAVAGRVSAAKVVLTSPDPGTLAPVLAAAGGALRRLHSGLAAGLVDRPPPGPRRLAGWLRRTTGAPAAQRLYQAVRARLGGARIDTAVAWCDDLARRADTGTVVLHGAPSLGGLIVADRAGESCLLIGEDLARGPAGFDLGWLLGELVEFRMLFDRAASGRGAALEELAGALRAGYGAAVDPVQAGRAAALRMFTHAHDFAAYVGWHDDLVRYVDRIAGLIDEQGASALSPAPITGD